MWSAKAQLSRRREAPHHEVEAVTEGKGREIGLRSEFAQASLQSLPVARPRRSRLK